MKPPIEFRTKERRLQGFPPLTKFMYEVLTILAYADDRDEPFEYLDGVRKHTIYALIKHGYIIEAMATELDSERYRITTEGKRAYNAYSEQQTRRDGICPICGKRPNVRGGNRCRSCRNAAQKRARQLKRPQSRADRPCSRCGKRKRYIAPSGIVSTWCKSCLRRYNRKHRRERNKVMLERINNGELVLCADCKVNPVYVCNQNVYSYCHDCYCARQRKWRKAQSTILQERAS